jgi:hypothetical protein
MPETDRKGNTIYRMESQVNTPHGTVDRGQQLGNIMRDHTSENKYVQRPLPSKVTGFKLNCSLGRPLVVRPALERTTSSIAS